MNHRRATLRGAAQQALDVLCVIRDMDAENDVRDPDVVEAIAALERAMQVRTPRPRSEPRNRWGYRPGERLHVTGGRLAGRTVEYVRACSSVQVYVAYNGGRFAVRAHLVERAV